MSTTAITMVHTIDQPHHNPHPPTLRHHTISIRRRRTPSPYSDMPDPITVQATCFIQTSPDSRYPDPNRNRMCRPLQHAHKPSPRQTSTAREIALDATRAVARAPHEDPNTSSKVLPSVSHVTRCVKRWCNSTFFTPVVNVNDVNNPNHHRKGERLNNTCANTTSPNPIAHAKIGAIA